MKLIVKEKFISMHRKFYVKNENDENVFEISSKPISIGFKTTIKDLKGEKKAYIEEEVLHLMSHYKIYIGDKFICKIAKKFKILKNDYSITNGYKVNGDFFSLNFSIYNDKNEEIGRIKRKFFAITDKYEIDIPNDKDKMIVLAIVVAISNDVNREQENTTDFD